MTRDEMLQLFAEKIQDAMWEAVGDDTARPMLDGQAATELAAAIMWGVEEIIRNSVIVADPSHDPTDDTKG